MQPLDSSRPQRVLVVDDNVGAAVMLSKLVKMVGDHEVDMAHDGPSALDRIQETKPDLVFLDIGLPGRDGYQVAQDIRRDPQCAGVFLVALTAYGDEEDQRKSEKAGIDKHIVKPPSIHQIQAIFAHPKLAATAAPRSWESPSSIEELSAVKNKPPASADSARIPNVDVSRLRHDLGNTAHVIKMAVQVLSQGSPGPAILQDVLDGLNHEVESLTKLIETLQTVQDSGATYPPASRNVGVESPE